MESGEKKEGYSLEEAHKKLRSNPLVYATIILGIVGILFPLIGWLFYSEETAKSDLETLKGDLQKVQESYKKVYAIVDKVVEDESHRWKLLDHERKLLKKLAQERRNLFIEFMSLVYFLMQGGFFFCLGLLLERRFFGPRRSAAFAKKEAPPKPASEVQAPKIAAETPRDKPAIDSIPAPAGLVEPEKASPKNESGPQI